MTYTTLFHRQTVSNDKLLDNTGLDNTMQINNNVGRSSTYWFLEPGKTKVLWIYYH